MGTVRLHKRLAGLQTDFLADNGTSVSKDLLILFVFFGIVFFQCLWSLPLIDPDEGRYAEIPREMIELGDFITPHLNYVKYFEKPPLHYWLNAIAFSIFAQNEFAARFSGTLCGLFGILLTYHIGRRLFGRREAFLSSVILGTSIGYFVQSRINITDMTLTLLMSACLGSFILAAKDAGRNKRIYYRLFYVFAALAVLTKGLIGIVLPCGIVLLYMALTRRWAVLKEMRLPEGIILFLFICVPWFIVVSIKNPEFPRFFFVHEHLERFLTKAHSRYQPPWFFVLILAGSMFPWSFFIPAAFARIWKERRGREFDALIFLLLWVAVIFVFFSISSSKLIPYILPVFPATALIIGKGYAPSFSGEIKMTGIYGYATPSFCFLLGTAVLIYPHLSGNPYFGPSAGAVLGSLWIIEGLLSFVSVYTRNAAALFIVLASFSLLLCLVGPPLIYPKVVERQSVKELALIVGEKAGPHDIVANYGWYAQGLSFYSKRRVMVIGGPGELEFGSMQGNQSAWFIGFEEFSRMWDSYDRIFTLIRMRDMAGFQKSVMTPIIVLGQKGDKLLIANR